MSASASGAPAPPQVQVQWAWGGDHRQWELWDNTASTTIENAFRAGSLSIDLQIQQVSRLATYRIDFQSLTQTNLATGFVRGLRRFLVPGGPRPAVRQFQFDAGGYYQDFDLDLCVLFDEVARLGRSSCVFFVDPRSQYHLDFNTMVQTNMYTSMTRQVVVVGAGGQAGGGALQPGDPGNIREMLGRCPELTANRGEDSCSVCYCDFTKDSPGLELPCKHCYHRGCIEPWLLRTPKCPICSRSYGITLGNMPPGTMNVQQYGPGQLPLQGYEREGTLVLKYNIPSGTQGPDHPNPGRRFHGTSKEAYLPDNAEGRELLALLRKAFDRRLMFTVGTSITTGRSDCVIWNGIHMKTQTAGGPQVHGYPDPDYLSRLREELKAKGVE